MAEDERVADDVAPNAAVFVVVDVRGADADGADADQHLAGPRARRRDIAGVDLEG